MYLLSSTPKKIFFRWRDARFGHNTLPSVLGTLLSSNDFSIRLRQDLIEVEICEHLEGDRKHYHYYQLSSAAGKRAFDEVQDDLFSKGIHSLDCIHMLYLDGKPTHVHYMLKQCHELV